MKNDHTQAKAREAENTILWLLHRFGFMTSAQVAVLAYRGYAQAQVMARRTLLRMHENNLVLIRKGAAVYSEQHYALSQAGARAVFQMRGIKAISGKDLIRAPSAHRDAANWCAIHLHYEHCKQIWTEREIQAGHAPIKHVGKKIPDFLAADDQGYCTWGEVEASRRGGRDMQHLADWLRNTAYPPNTGNYLISRRRPRKWCKR